MDEVGNNKQYYELSIYTPVEDNIYRRTKTLFDSHERGMRWAIDNYGWTDALYTGEYINTEGYTKPKEFTYWSNIDVEHFGAQSISDLQKLIRQLKGKE